MGTGGRLSSRAPVTPVRDLLLELVSDLLLTSTLVFVLPFVLLTSGATWARFSLRRANRVGPGRSTATAPIPWLWSPGVAASLHRRLRTACHLAGTVISSRPEPPRRRWPKKNTPAPVDSIVELAREVVQEAVELDRELVTTSWLARGLPKAQALAALGYRVSAVEDAARRVHQLDTSRSRISSTPGAVGLTLGERISVMEAAFGELSPRPPAGLGTAGLIADPAVTATAEAQALTRPA